MHELNHAALYRVADLIGMDHGAFRLKYETDPAFHALAYAFAKYEVGLSMELRQLLRLGREDHPETPGYIWSAIGVGGLREDAAPIVAALLGRLVPLESGRG